MRPVLEKIWEYNEAVHLLFIAFKKAYDSVRREELYNIVIAFGIPTKLLLFFKKINVLFSLIFNFVL
jgi:hypothetical protein